ncbi:MAG TPA: Ig-like domain-containing protein, partial [Candidatus Deferrimicrobium sp.]|nr:Ig-like domain-containing protein [Candidatus Deferrimicrobium sp.]
GINLTFNVSATDAEGTPTFTTSALPGTATFVDNLDGTGTFNWTPTFTEAGSYPVTFRAVDAALAVDTEIVTITVTEAGNQPPVLATIGPRGTTEGINLTFNVSATDAEGTPTFTTSALPGTATFVDNLDGTGTFNWTPTFTEAGSYPVTFRAVDAALAVDSEIVTITVTEAGNQSPVLATIGPQSTTEGINLTFNVSATDAESTPTFTTSALPGTATFVDNLDGTGTFNWTPTFTEAGSYPVTFWAVDAALAVDSEIVTITVTEAGNQPPVLATIGPQIVTEGGALNFVASATDLDGVLPVMTSSILPGTASYIDNGDGTGSFAWVTTFADSGTYAVTFYATDGAFPTSIDSEIVTITVTNVNQSPVLALIGPQNVPEGATLNFVTSAIDPDSDIPVMTSSTLPGTATYVDNGNGTGTFNWVTTFADSGTYTVTFYATDGIFPTSIDSELVTITVTNVNQVPVLAAIGTQTIIEGGTLNFGVSAADPDGQTPVLTTSALPGTATFVDNGAGAGTFNWVTTVLDAGTYFVTFYATDLLFPAAIDSEVVTIVVAEAGNQAPVFAPIADTTVFEGSTLVLNISATDPEGGAVTLSVNTTMNGYTFVDNGNGTGVFTYQPGYDDAGLDTVRFFATDNGTPRLSGVEAVAITTIDINQPPQFAPAGPFGVEIGDTLIFTLTAMDPTDTTGARLYLSVVNPPANSQFVDNANNTGTFRFIPVTGQQGTDTLTFLATDQGTPALTGAIDIRITVVTVNIPPVLNPIGPKSVREGNTLIVHITGTDTDGPPPVLQVVNAPTNSSFIDSGNGSAVFTFTPSFVQAKLYSVTFKAYDGMDIDKEIVMIQVLEAGNQRPVFDSLPGLSVVEGDTLRDVVVAHDPDTLPITITFDPATMPPNFSYFDSGNGTAVILFAPVYNQAGNYNVSVIVSDGSLADTGLLAIDVIEAGNQVPVLSAIGNKSVKETQVLSFSVSATDADSVLPRIYARNIPAGANFPDTADSVYGSAVFSWLTDFNDSGTYVVTFYAEDGSFPAILDSEMVSIIVADSNRAPFIFFFPQRDTVSEGSTLRFLVSANDPDGPAPIMRASLSGEDTLATNMTYFDSGNGSAVLTFTPDYTQGNNNPSFYYVVFRAHDAADTTIVSTISEDFRVFNKNQRPTNNFSPGPGPYTIVEGDSVVFSVNATDPDGGLPTLTASGIPVNATWQQFVQNAGILTFYPSFSQAGTYQPRFIARDAAGLADTDIVVINVTNAGNQSPVFSTTLPDTTDAFAGSVDRTVVRASDPDLDSIILLADIDPGMASSASFHDSGNGTGVLSYAFDVGDVGSVFLVVFRAVDYPSGAADTIRTYYRVLGFLRGDTDHNDKYTMNDIVVLIGYMFRGGPVPVPLESGDVDMSGAINVADIAYLVNYLYASGPRPPQ